MISDIVTVIAKIAEEGIKNKMPPDKVTELLTKEKTFDPKIIATAYSWIVEKIKRDLKTGVHDFYNPSFRILSNDEKNLLGNKIYNHLLNFYNTGILNNIDMEKIIEQVKMLPEENITLDNINILILFTFLSAENESLPGSRLMLYSSDTIN